MLLKIQFFFFYYKIFNWKKEIYEFKKKKTKHKIKINQNILYYIKLHFFIVIYKHKIKKREQ